ncbi:hypothetical protein PIB30_028863 [Stylosanthes scabra]|uniref:SCP domain-containing protein n=1 Tax=Stylosanthes scabra TaxID=79078 RepID=A0ABU6WE58_9FABA|nr:hypothetical protein [Stylosanthes scabra]
MKMLLNILAVFLSFASIVPLCSLEPVVPQSSPKDYLDYHNDIRKDVWSSPLKWDPQLETYARNFLNKHKMDCLGRKPFIASGIGWNIARNWGNRTFSGTDAVWKWVIQRENYDKVTNTCVRGDCRGYTQVVWKDSVRLGCARVRCNNDIGTMVRCNYVPPGNIPGQRPF